MRIKEAAWNEIGKPISAYNEANFPAYKLGFEDL